MNRRELIRLGSVAVVAAPFIQIGCGSSDDNTRRLFFDPADVEKIRQRAQAPRLAGTLQQWATADPSEVKATIGRVLISGDLLSDLSTSMTTVFNQCIVHLITGSEQSAQLVEHGLAVLEELPTWDYMRDGDSEGDGDVLGLMRASKASGCTLLALQVLGDRVDKKRRSELLRGVADKGCEPCSRTIAHMDNPGSEKGWGVEAAYRERVNVDMSNWPGILGTNNLRAIPTMGLGLGALALTGVDSRAAKWLEQSVASSITFMGLLESDGSYFEGISYIDFAFRSLFPFFDAYDRIRGDVDWTAHADFHGVCEYIATLQNGLNEDGTPDIINISDARDTVFICVPAWIAARTGDPLAQYAAQHFARPGFYADFLWYDPNAVAALPDDSLLNSRLDLDWVVCRTGWRPEDTVVGFRSGQPTNHEHADRNSVLVKSGGERLLTDPFGASYNPADPHWLLRLTAGHNAVLIDGQGHQYHNGEEGTSAGLAQAGIIDFTDNGNSVHWTSDATHGYKLVHPAIKQVIRSVLFIKPDLIILVDRVTSDRGVEIGVRFHPDNRDDLASISVEAYEEFSIVRPRARLDCTYNSNTPVRAQTSSLELPSSLGSFPFVELLSARTTDSTIVTAMNVTRTSAADEARHPTVKREYDGSWRVTVEGVEVIIRITDRVPTFEVQRLG